MESLGELLNSLGLEEGDIFEYTIKNGQTPDIVFAGLLNILDNYEIDDLDSCCDDYVWASIGRVLSLVADASEKYSNKDSSEVKEFFHRSIVRLVTKIPEWIWPVVYDGPNNHEHSGRGGPYEFNEFSALKMFGYTVGKSGWPKDKRHDFLTDFIEMELPEIVEETFGDEYGKPNTTDRLRKVANVIAGICSLNVAKNNPNLDQAISDWLTDLDFLKKKYYEDAGLQFVPWPDPRSQQ